MPPHCSLCTPLILPPPQGVLPEGRRAHAADVVAGRYLVVHGGYDGTRLLADAHTLDTETATWSLLEASPGGEGGIRAGGGGGGDAPPAARSLHTLTSVGHACVLLGGSGAAGGALGDVALLESPAVTAGLAQQRRLLGAQRALGRERQAVAALRGRLGQAELERDWRAEQQAAVEARAAELTGRWAMVSRLISLGPIPPLLARG